MRSRRTSRPEQGYILITLLLFVALLAISAASMAPLISQQIRRDREEEMIHRGVQYSRAVRRFFKKSGRYPVRLEELENTNNLRFLRKRYKDPITGNDFKVLHLTEVKLTFGGGIGGMMPGTPNLAAGGGTSFTPQPDQQASGGAAQSPNSPQPLSRAGDALSNTVFGGGAIAGVVSTSEKETIHEFNKKHHYNEWQFIYDPTTDRGGLLTTPAQPALAGAAPIGQPAMPGATGAPSTTPGPAPNPQPVGPQQN